MDMIPQAKMTRTLGRSGIQVSAMGLGCWAIGGVSSVEGTAGGWHGINDDESIRAIHRALEMGINFLDTANVYGKGHSERVLARALAGFHRDQVIIASKFGWGFNEETLEDRGSTATPDDIRQSCEYSLRRLNTDYLDLFQFHDGNYPLEQAGDVLDTLEALVSEGKIRYYGWSTDHADRARFFAQGTHCTAVQVEMNVVQDAAEVLAVCEEFDLAAINRSPLAMGLLTGKYTASSVLPDDDVRGPNAPYWSKYFVGGKPTAEWIQRIEAVREILSNCGGRTLAQAALAWLWARNERTIPIPGFKTVAQVEDNVAAMDFGPLDADTMREIDTLLGR